MAATSRPGAMSLLDKYSSINSSIEDARRRVAEVRSNLERSNEKISNLREERDGMLVETEAANLEKLRIQADLNEAKGEHHSKLSEKDRMRREHQLAKSEHDGMRRRTDDERMEFLERCREFRASCKRMRVAATILVLDGGDNFDAKDASDDMDLWRRLQEEDFSDDDDDDEDSVDSNNNDDERPNKRKHRKPDPEVEQTEKDEKESRQALIEAECALHAVRSANADAIKRCNARTQRLAQQRAQLQRHRQEEEEMEREIQKVKDDIVHQNQLANTFEKGEFFVLLTYVVGEWIECHKSNHVRGIRTECNKRKQIRDANANARYSNASYSSNFNPPPEASRPGNNNPYNYRTPQNASASGHQRQPPRGGTVSNPYKTSRTPKAPTPPRNAPSNNRRGQNGRVANNPPPYAAGMLGHQGQMNRQQSTQKNPHHGRHVRNQRQFGTSVGVSLGDNGMTAELEECMAAFSTDAQQAATSSSAKATGGDDDISDVSSTSSDEDILSFQFFGNK
ncbi:hypothetical protein ACHAXR_012605 [Thalassiosira sp. AJA248-18]